MVFVFVFFKDDGGDRRDIRENTGDGVGGKLCKGILETKMPNVKDFFKFSVLLW